MIKSDKKFKELSALLSRENSLLICEGIGLLRDEEPFEGAIGLLASFYDKTDDIIIRKTIEGFMNDIKDQSVSGEIITEINRPYRKETITMLVASCWQSGLNYSGYSSQMAEVFLRSEYITALECFTVIEESVHEMSPAKRKELIGIIKKSSPLASGEKAGLTRELIAVLKEE
jgi:predicted DNA-binding protein